MRKNLLIIVLLIIVLIVGCDQGKPLRVEERGINTVGVMIERQVLTWATNPYLFILAKEVSFDYNQRTIVCKGLINIRGNGGWVVPELNVEDNNLVICMPKDTFYNVYIGENHHYLPAIK